VIEVPKEASAKGTRMEAPMGWSLAYDRVAFNQVTAQVMNLLMELDYYYKNG